MSGRMDIREDTIAAISTPSGNGGIGIVRLSGPEAEHILARIFQPAGKEIRPPFESHRLIYGHLMDGGETVDECMAVLMRAPRSYTREDVAEIHLHGGSYVVSRALGLCFREGARLAEAGEFTRRAFLNGRIDLSQAEAVMELISARGEQEHRAAIREMQGGASGFIRPLADRLYEIQAGLAACIDYPEEISEEEGTAMLREGIRDLLRRIEEAVDEHASRLIHQGLQVVLAGRPNVGKSSLLNALLEEDRAIVTEIPGTTRDVIRGEMMIGGVRIQLTDTAGIRDTEDPVERIGVERSESARQAADLTLLVIDGSRPLDEEDRELIRSAGGACAAVINKTDLPAIVTENDIRDIRPELECMTVSANVPESLRPIRETLRKYTEISDRIALTQPRQIEAAERAASHLRDAIRTLDAFTPDMASTDLQAAQEALSEITGDRADEKLLDHVFERFCVGK